MTHHLLIRLNLTFYSLLLFFIISADWLPSFFLWPQVFAALFIIFFLSGANWVNLFISLISHHYDSVTFICLSILSSIFITPLLVLLTFLALHRLDASLILLLYALPLLFSVIPYLREKNIYASAKSRIPFDFSLLTLRKYLYHPVLWAFFLIFVLQTVNTFMFPFLPAPDSYFILINFNNAADNQQLFLDTDSNRWAFAAFIASIHHLTRLDFYVIFKYIFPYISLLVLFPLWLIARHFPLRSWQFLILMAAAFSPTLILELAIARQQTLFLIYLYFAIAFLIQSASRRDQSLYYLTGLFSFFGVFVHPLFFLFLLSWIVSAFWHNRSFFFRHYKLISLILLLTLPLLSQRHFFSNIFNRLGSQFSIVLANFLSGRWNLLFPTSYKNTDGLQMGWSGLDGLIKYYGFYAGPLALAIIFFCFYFFLSGRKSSNSPFKLIRYPHRPLIILIFFFFFIAEIAPRIANHSYLPDRAWQYLGILLIYPLFIILLAWQRGHRSSNKFLLLFFIPIFITIIGSIYVNYLISHKMPDYELRASRWINENLPDNRIVFTSSSKYLLLYHANSQRLILEDSYLQNNDLSATLDHINKSLLVHRARILAAPHSRHSHNTWYNPNLAQLSLIYDAINHNVADGVNHLQSLYQDGHLDQVTLNPIINQAHGLATFSNQARDSIVAALDQTDRQLAIDDIKRHSSLSGDEVHEFNSVYIYYARTHPRNPYATRPYKSSFTVNHNFKHFPALENNPDTFELVYRDGDDVFIWQAHL